MKKLLALLLAVCVVMGCAGTACGEEIADTTLASALCGFWKLTTYMDLGSRQIMDIAYVTTEDEAVIVEIRHDGTLTLYMMQGGTAMSELTAGYALEGNTLTTDLFGFSKPYIVTVNDDVMQAVDEDYPMTFVRLNGNVQHEPVPMIIGDKEISAKAFLYGGPVSGKYALIPLVQVLESLGIPFSWESDTIATVTLLDKLYRLDTTIGSLYLADKEPEQWNKLEVAPGDVPHTVWKEGSGTEFLVDSELCRMVFYTLGYYIVVDLENLCVRVYPR